MEMNRKPLDWNHILGSKTLPIVFQENLLRTFLKTFQCFQVHWEDDKITNSNIHMIISKYLFLVNSYHHIC